MKSTYQNTALNVANLVGRKQVAYGDSFGKSWEIIKVLYPEGIKVTEYVDFLCVIRIIDKLFRVATEKDALNENPWRDIMGYALLATGKQPRDDIHGVD